MLQSRLKRRQNMIFGTLHTWLLAVNIKDDGFTIYAALNWCTGRRHSNYLHRIPHKTLPCNDSQTCDTCSSLHRCLRSDTVMTCKESEIIIKNFDVKCLLFINVILFRVQVSKQEKKGEGDIRLNNSEILSSVTFTPVPVRFLSWYSM